MQLTEGQTYSCGNQILVATFLLGTWVLRRIDEVATGEIVAYRQMPDGWRECRYVAAVIGEELVYGSTVDLAALTPVAMDGAASDIDEAFTALMAEMDWEWQ